MFRNFLLHILLFSFSTIQCLLETIHRTPTSLIEPELESFDETAELKATVDALAQSCLDSAYDYLDNRYDYRQAIAWFQNSLSVYETGRLSSPTQSFAAEVYTGLAMSYHHLGYYEQRNRCMQQVEKLLLMSGDLGKHAATAFINYFVVNGYRWSVRYEQSKANADSLAAQEALLDEAQKAFNSALEISKKLNILTIAVTHAHQGLGSVFECRSTCEQEKGNLVTAKERVHQAIEKFKKALTLREELLGNSHLHVARSCHKLARNYISLAHSLKDENPHETEILTIQAQKLYKQAAIIFNENRIPFNHPKILEFHQDYNDLQRNLTVG